MPLQYLQDLCTSQANTIKQLLCDFGAFIGPVIITVRTTPAPESPEHSTKQHNRKTPPQRSHGVETNSTSSAARTHANSKPAKAHRAERRLRTSKPHPDSSSSCLGSCPCRKHLINSRREGGSCHGGAGSGGEGRRVKRRARYGTAVKPEYLRIPTYEHDQSVTDSAGCVQRKTGSMERE